MIKKLVRRHRLVAVPLLFAMGGVVLPWHQPAVQSGVADPPTQIIVKEATSTIQGVSLEWLEGQAGKHPIDGYIIERSRANSGFTFVARVEKISLKYLDAEGKSGDTYHVFAEDDQKPAQRSASSQPIVAAPAKPGEAVLVATSPRQASVDQTVAPGTRADMLQRFITQAFTDFDTALHRHDLKSARGTLTILQDYLRQALTLLPQLSADQRTPLIDACKQNLGVFETNAHTLTEQDQMDSLVVIAGCDAVVNSAR